MLCRIFSPSRGNQWPTTCPLSVGVAVRLVSEIEKSVTLCWARASTNCVRGGG
jgi:hypothetical protein